MSAVLTEDERDQMAHAIGHHSNGGRNHYVTASDDPLWTSLVDRGLARTRRSSILPGSESSFVVTDAGRCAIEADPRSKRKGRPFTVFFRGYPLCPVHVRAETHAKARYAAVMRVEDAWNVTASQGFKMIRSCRLGS